MSEKNSVKAVISGSSCTITSTLKLKDLKRYELLHPEALVLWDDDKPVFKIYTDEGPGRITKDFAVYGESTTAEGYATITVVLNPAEEDKKELIYKKMGSSLLLLNELEDGLTEGIKQLEKEEAEIKSMIELK